MSPGYLSKTSCDTTDLLFPIYITNQRITNAGFDFTSLCFLQNCLDEQLLVFHDVVLDDKVDDGLNDTLST